MQKRILLLFLVIAGLTGYGYGQSAGDLIITELMADPNDVTDANGEYFELYNVTNDTLDLNGYKISDATSTHVISGTLKIAPKSFLVFAENGTVGTNGGVNADYDYPAAITLNNTVDTLFIHTGGDVLITRAAYSDGNPFGAGVAMELSDLSLATDGLIDDADYTAATDNVDGAGTDKGSPGKPGNTDLDVTVISGTAGWRLISFPKTGAVVTDVSDDTPVQGITGGDNSGSSANFYIYDDSGAWEEPTNVTTAFGDGYGFALYFYNNTTNGSSTLPIALDASGSEPGSDVTRNLNKTTTHGGSSNYFTLMGNPFASNFDLNSITTNGTGLQDNAHFWDDGASSYQTGDRGTGSFIVAPWQGFWLEIANAGTATTTTLPTTGKSTSNTTATYFSKQSSAKADVSFVLHSNTTTDKAIRLAFRDYSTLDFDRADASKLIPLTTEYAILAFRSNDMLKSVESLPIELNEEVMIPMELDLVGVEGDFTLEWSGLNEIPGEYELLFTDHETGETIELRAQTSYTFNASAQSQAKVNPLTILKGPQAESMRMKAEDSRFTLVVRPASVSNEEERNGPEEFRLSQNYPNPFNPSTSITYSLSEASRVNISVFNLMGQKVATLVDAQKAKGTHTVRWNASSMTSGMYYYRLEANGKSLTRKMTLIK